MTKGERECYFTKEQDTPNSLNIFLYHTPMKETMRNNILVDMLQQAMTMLYTESVREDEGGAYSVPVGGYIIDYPEEIAQMQIILPTAPEKRLAMTSVVSDGIKKMMEQGPSEENLAKIKEYMLRSHQEDLKNNGYWMSQITASYQYNENRDGAASLDDFTKRVKKGDLDQVFTCGCGKRVAYPAIRLASYVNEDVSR